MKVLIITYYWPPAGGPGVQRWLKFVKYFSEFGIEPIVYVPENPSYPIQDDSLGLEIPEGVNILKKRIFEPYSWAHIFSKKETQTISKGIIAADHKQSFVQRALLFIRGNFFIPDARKYWVRPSVTYLKKYCQKNDISTIITTGPPHSMHLIGAALKKKLGIHWLADFRDPWTTIGYHQKLKLTSRAQRKHKALEKRVLQTADHITVTSFTTKKEFQSLTNTEISVITNGYDIELKEEIPLDKNFTISHIGSLLSGRNPENLWKTLYELTQENKDFAAVFTLQLIGAVAQDVLESIYKAGLKPYVTCVPYVAHQEAIKLQKASQVLLLIEIDSPETRCIIPGKVFEYMVSKRPILALGPQKADVSKIIKETNSGSFFEYTAADLLKKTINMYFEQYKNGSLQANSCEIDQYSRRALTKKMAAVIKSL